jgi:DNA (cytosine-5)-methyltransferase 1
MMTHGSLFSGIGGFDLGFERAGIETVWQVEIDAYCRKVLAKHFPKAQRFEDIRECFGQHCAFAETRKNYLRGVDILSGGFPCQDISNAGKRAGIDGERSGLWSEYARIIRELRPRYVVVENVAALLGRGMERVLGDLAAIGYDAEWESIRASDVGAPHRRERIWIVAYPESDIRRTSRHEVTDAPDGARNNVADAEQSGLERFTGNGNGWAERQGQNRPTSASSLCDTAEQGFQDRPIFPLGESGTDTKLKRSDWWAVEPNVGRVAHGIPARVDRLKGLGNAVVPQITELIGRRLVEVA